MRAHLPFPRLGTNQQNVGIKSSHLFKGIKPRVKPSSEAPVWRLCYGDQVV